MNYQDGPQFHVRKPDIWSPWDFSLHLRWRTERDGQVTYGYPKPLEFSQAGANDAQQAGIERPPLIQFDHLAAQQLMDSLWAAGIRPTEAQGSAGAFDSQGKHLEDMRRLVARQMGVELK